MPRLSNPTRTGTWIVMVLLLAGGCAQRTATVATFPNGGDNPPRVFSSDLTRKDLENLDQGESVALAMGNEAALARPNRTEVQLEQEISPYQKQGSQKKNCDFDQDGIDEIPCPKKASNTEGQGSEKEFALQAYKYVKNPQDYWKAKTVIRKKNLAKQNTVAYRIILLNSGDKDFKGTIQAFDRLPPALRYKSLEGGYLVQDQRGVKKALSMVIGIQLLAFAMDKFRVLEDVPITAQTNKNLVEFRADKVHLEPGEGLMIQFEAELFLPEVEKVVSNR